MPQVQAQIVVHGERDPEKLSIAEAAEIYQELMDLGVVPLAACIQRRDLLEKKCIDVEVFQIGTVPDLDDPDDRAELAPPYELDPTRPEIFVDPHDFLAVGASCVAHRHILVSPLIELPAELDWEIDWDALTEGDD